MTIINAQTLSQLNPAEFRNQKPFPHLNIKGFLTDQVFDELYETLPDPAMLKSEFGKARGYGQQSHDRLSLQYQPGLALSPSWQEFIDVLHGHEYEQFIRSMYGLKAGEPIVLTMHWHYAMAGCSVSPHVDARRKLGSHIFYFHKSEEWNEDWGGQTVVLSGRSALRAHSAPSFEEFNVVAASKITDNHSFIFNRTPDSWHGVRPLTCPKDRLRKVFIVVINKVTLQVRWRALRGKDADGHPVRRIRLARS